MVNFFCNFFNKQKKNSFIFDLVVMQIFSTVSLKPKHFENAQL